MVISTFIKEAGKKLIKPIIILAIIYIALIILPNKNLLTINLTIITIILISKITTQKPELKDWAITITRTAIFISALYYIIMWLGTLGIIGGALIIIVYSAVRIITGWKLYKYTINWASDMMIGKKTRFDINELTNKEEQKKQRNNESNKKRPKTKKNNNNRHMEHSLQRMQNQTHKNSKIQKQKRKTK